MSYFHLTSEERYVISHLALYGLSLREIGQGPFKLNHIFKKIL
jgi:IS30 family transposase